MLNDDLIGWGQPKKTAQIKVGCSPAQRAKILQAAQDNGMTASEFLLAIWRMYEASRAEKEAEQKTEIVPDIISEIKGDECRS